MEDVLPMLLPRVLCPLQPGGAAVLDGQCRDPRPLRTLSSPKQPNSLGVGVGVCAHVLGALGLAGASGGGVRWEKCFFHVTLGSWCLLGPEPISLGA